ncbi:MAG: purine-binding chemotaxis protein CheW [Nitrospira sp.]|nr:purine-binding chemotaxis protein CheW [Nitrospira sp.]MBX3371293.1 purine-binding chemotaxis protein CheW [Nitrospira sp.]
MSDVPIIQPQASASSPAQGSSASSRSSAASTEGALRMCVLTLGGELFAIDLRHVSEVFEVEAVTAVPSMPSYLTGVTNLRGTVITLVDLRGSLGLSVNNTALPFAVVIRHGARQVGVLVDHVPEIHTVPREHLLPAMQAGPAGARPCVSAVLRLDHRLGGVLEVPQVFAQVDGGSAALSVV